ncbi:uncharacterized protein DSM5745_01702 [Aspergillus mulundensis]|uniref:Protein kinase domain-containing protein n=1 Tax=Aspergillus mulundensis TaxID=1810919 RepID=A0A3D8SUE3_9EURO|nr:hypothetical protein DSM5745_01702 [Aspergillus mulundensis]RDW89927.1 hypothetical protein DSM5745_01702 [Aspergillus mulundensis]
MARTTRTLLLRPTPGSRPADLFDKILQFRAKNPNDRQFPFEIGNSGILVEQVDENTVVLLSNGFSEMLDPYSDPPLERYTDEDHMSTNGDAGKDESRVWKTTRVYEVIGNPGHPRLVQFRGRDPWTALPILQKPAATLAGFLDEHRASMYAYAAGDDTEAEPSGSEKHNGNARLYLKLNPAYRPLIFQWALQLLSALGFIHARNVILGDLHVHTCWLSAPDFSISILGFLDAVYMEPMHGTRYTNESTWGSEYNFPFHPRLIPGRGTGPGGRWDRDVATAKTDLFLWAALVFELLTGCWPAGDRNLEDVKGILARGLWPRLGEGGLDGILGKCWDLGYADADEVKRDLVLVVEGEGWEVGGVQGDEIRGLDGARILRD